MKRKKWVIITGAGSGIGEEFAIQLSDMGYSLILVGRTANKLESVRKRLLKRQKSSAKKTGERDTDVRIIAKDLASMSGCYSALDKISGIMQTGTADTVNTPAILINSAGFGIVGEFSEIDIDRQEEMVDVNIKALMLFTYRMIDMMEKSGGGRILNVASSAGLFPGGPYMSVYYASKSFVVSFTNGISRELREKGSKVKVSCLCPGPVNTPFNVTAGVRNPLHGISPHRCVKAAIKGMKKDKTIIIPEIPIRFAALGAKILPDCVMLPMVAHQQKKKL